MLKVLIVGGAANNSISPYNYSQPSFIGGGDNNKLLGSVSSFLGGGSYNTITSSEYSAVIGGSTNRIITSSYSAIVGGKNNIITGSLGYQAGKPSGYNFW